MVESALVLRKRSTGWELEQCLGTIHRCYICGAWLKGDDAPPVRALPTHRPSERQVAQYREHQRRLREGRSVADSPPRC